MKWTAILITSLFLQSCVEVKMDDLTRFVTEIKKQYYPINDKLPALIDHAPLRFTQQQARNPFFKSKQLNNNVDNTNTSKNCWQPDFKHAVESLEHFSLGDLQMRGTLKLSHELWAIVEASNGIFYKVKPGNYLGFNNGKILSISETAISLSEFKIKHDNCWEKQITEMKLLLN